MEPPPKRARSASKTYGLFSNVVLFPCIQVRYALYWKRFNYRVMETSSIIFPLSTNIKSFQRWGDNDISKRIKQSLILYDKVILETGTYKLEGKDAVLQGFTPLG